MKIGIYGGTFNPPHRGHTEAAAKAVTALGLERLIIVPSGIPPHKTVEAGSPDGKCRIKMAGLAFGDIPCAQVSDFEVSRDGVSYTIDTVRHISQCYPDSELYLLMGTDMYISLENWRDSDLILEQVTPVVFARNEGDYELIHARAEYYLETMGIQSEVVEIAITEAASTDIRGLLRIGKGREYLSDDVYAYIVENQLYEVKPQLDWLRSQGYAMLKRKRVPHVKGCEEEAARLAARWNENDYDAREAGILHDCTKKCSRDEQLILCERYDILTDSLERQSEKLLHAKTGAAIARARFGVPDRVHDAIYWHTTGRAAMTVLEKIIYLADYIEPTRQFDGAEELRKLCYEDIDKAMALGLQMSVDELEEKGASVYPSTLAALEYYKTNIRKDESLNANPTRTGL